LRRCVPALLTSSASLLLGYLHLLLSNFPLATTIISSLLDSWYGFLCVLKNPFLSRPTALSWGACPAGCARPALLRRSPPGVRGRYLDWVHARSVHGGKPAAALAKVRRAKEVACKHANM
jgi:hypothetical protein